jgi:hypothetical protein
MKRTIAYLMLLFIIFSLTVPVVALGVEPDTPEPSRVSITITLPETPQIASAEASPEIASIPEIPPPPQMILYPSGVNNGEIDGQKYIVKTYELEPGENPDCIPRDSFERGGYLYDLTDITRTQNADTSVIAHTETVTADSADNDTESILTALAPTIEYKSESGYFGVLALDLATITVEASGKKSSTYVATKSRDYLNLSANDTSLLPKTVTENGATYTLDTVTWQANGELYNASAKYPANASKTTITGYSVSADYSGKLTKISLGKTVYTAYFLGKVILPLEVEFTETSPVAPITPTVETPVTSPIVTPTEAVKTPAIPATPATPISVSTSPTPTAESENSAEKQNGNMTALKICIVVFVLLGVAILKRKSIANIIHKLTNKEEKTNYENYENTNNSNSDDNSLDELDNSDDG